MKAYIFDLDGTLLDSMGVWERIDVDFLALRGIEVPSDYMNTIAVMSFSEAAAYTIERFSLSDQPEALMAEWHEMARFAYGNTVTLKPGARKFLNHLKKRGVKMAIATSCYADLYQRALRNLELEDMFDAIVTTGEAGHSKARPDVFLLAAEQLGARASNCVVFEDILEAVRSAKEAGMTVYGIYDQASRDHWETIKAMADGAFLDFTEVPLPR